MIVTKPDGLLNEERFFRRLSLVKGLSDEKRSQMFFSYHNRDPNILKPIFTLSNSLKLSILFSLAQWSDSPQLSGYGVKY